MILREASHVNFRKKFKYAKKLSWVVERFSKLVTKYDKEIRKKERVMTDFLTPVVCHSYAIYIGRCIHLIFFYKKKSVKKICIIFTGIGKVAPLSTSLCDRGSSQGLSSEGVEGEARCSCSSQPSTTAAPSRPFIQCRINLPHALYLLHHHAEDIKA